MVHLALSCVWPCQKQRFLRQLLFSSERIASVFCVRAQASWLQILFPYQRQAASHHCLLFFSFTWIPPAWLQESQQVRILPHLWHRSGPRPCYQLLMPSSCFWEILVWLSLALPSSLQVPCPALPLVALSLLGLFGVFRLFFFLESLAFRCFRVRCLAVFSTTTPFTYV